MPMRILDLPYTTVSLVVNTSTVARWQYGDNRHLIVGIHVSSFDVMETWLLPNALVAGIRKQCRKRKRGGKYASTYCECVCCWALVRGIFNKFTLIHPL